MSKLINIWCTYHDKSQLINYKLENNDIIKLFYVNNLSLSEDNINYLNTYLCEIVTYYYVWKNQIKSDYIGFCHYRRMFKSIKYDYIDDHHIQTLFNGGYHIQCNPLVDLFINYMKTKYNYNINNENIHKINKCSFKLSYIMTWNVFNNICDFLFGFYDYIGNELNTNWKTIEGQNQILRYLLSKKIHVEKWEYTWFRHISIITEFVLGCYINMFYDTNDFNNLFRNNIIILSNYNINQIYNCERLGISCSDIYICVESRKNIQNIYNYDLNNSFINYNELIKLIKENINHKKIIMLNDNEYIDCKNSFEFFKGNYSIKNIK